MSKEPIEWKDWLSHGGYHYGLEVIKDTIYSKRIVHSQVTKRIDFFSNVINTNLYLPNMLPNPQSFLIEHILIEGISSDLKEGIARLTIGNKYYSVTPVWLHTLRAKGWKCDPMLMIGSLVPFGYTLEWNEPVELGGGLDNIPLLYKSIRLVLIGKRARPIC